MDQKEHKKIHTPVEELPTPHRKILSIMPIGKDEPITITQIVKLLGGTYQATKDIIRELILDHGYKIGTINGHKNGHYLMDNEDERKDTIRNLESRIREIEKRKQAIANGPLH